MTSADRRRDVSHLAANLATLLASFDSVADFCRKLDINRQQFNKYLAGLHVPSQRVLSKLARHFMMEPDDLFARPPNSRASMKG